MADATGFPSAPSVVGSMAVAATVEELLRSTIGEQTHTLRGSAASQSLAADLANQVFQSFEGEGMEAKLGVCHSGGHPHFRKRAGAELLV